MFHLLDYLCIFRVTQIVVINQTLPHALLATESSKTTIPSLNSPVIFSFLFSFFVLSDCLCLLLQETCPKNCKAAKVNFLIVLFIIYLNLVHRYLDLP